MSEEFFSGFGFGQIFLRFSAIFCGVFRFLKGPYAPLLCSLLHRPSLERKLKLIPVSVVNRFMLDGMLISCQAHRAPSNFKEKNVGKRAPLRLDNHSINQLKKLGYDRLFDIKTTWPRFRSVRFFIRALFGKVFHPNLLSFVWRRGYVVAILRGTNMAAAQ